MGNFKEENGKTKIGAWIQENAPHLQDVTVGLLPEKGALGIIKNIIQKDDKIDPAKTKEAEAIIQEDLDAFALEAKDREGGRELYSKDSMIQKVFAIVFLVGYGFLCWYLLTILMGKSTMPKLAETMITMIWTGTSTKLNTIIDFFFGGSVK